MSTLITPQALRAAATRLPSSVQLIDALYQALNQPDVDNEHVVKLLSLDIAVATRLLRMANTAGFTRGEGVENIEQALNWLGLLQAYRVCCATLSARLCAQNLSVYRISADALLYNSIASAVAMELLAKEARLDPKTGYTLGLLRNLGRILFQRASQQHCIRPGAADLPDIQTVLAWEKNTHGITHTEAGAFILREWGLNPLFAAVTEKLYDPLSAEDPDIRRWAALLHIAATLVAMTDHNLGVTSDSWILSDEIFAACGLTAVNSLDLSARIATATDALCLSSGLSAGRSSSAVR